MTSMPQTHPLAGKLAPRALLVDLPKLITAYYSERPTPRSPRSAWRSARRATAASSFQASFNEAHVLAMTQAICSYRKQQGITGPVVSRLRHARVVRAGVRERARGAGGQ